MTSANDDQSSLEEDFGRLFEQSLNMVKPGEVVQGEIVQIANGFVTVDIGYKSEGSIPIAEFRDREGEVHAEVGQTVDVFFESSEGETGSVSLSRTKAEQFKVWGEVEEAYNAGEPIEGLIVGKGQGRPEGGHRCLRLPARLPCRPPSDQESRSVHRPEGPVRDPEVQPLPGQRGRLPPGGTRA